MGLKIISVTGAIGVGKTTVLKKLKSLLTNTNTLKYVFLFEPVETWISEGWLEKFYKNPSRYGFSFQMKILLQQVLSVNHAREMSKRENVVLITERSPYDAMRIFVPLCGADISEKKLYESYFNTIGWVPDHQWCIGCDSEEEMIRRVTKRGRPVERDEEAVLLSVYNKYAEVYGNSIINNNNSENTASLLRDLINELKLSQGE